MSARYAIYYAPPPGSLLWQAGCRWLGRDPESAEDYTPLEVPGWTEAKLREHTASARLYGFHATLKPPFYLADGTSDSALQAALQAFAASRSRFALPPLEVATLSGFLALRPVAHSEPLAALARAAVIELDAFRRPPSAEELFRRRAAGLSPRQERLLMHYGYPYVLEEFRFHLTLTDRLPRELAAELRPWLHDYFSEALAEPLPVDGLCLFVQDRPAAAFRLVRRFPFGDR